MSIKKDQRAAKLIFFAYNDHHNIPSIAVERKFTSPSTISDNHAYSL
jgi:hypothetical protein